MPWHAGAHPELPIVEVTLSGLLTPSELSDVVAGTLSLASSHGHTRILADCADLVGGHSFVDLYFAAGDVAATDNAHALKEAIILPDFAPSVEQARFWETTCMNRGIAVRVFAGRESALAWLLA
jgi:hypothetical protein